MLTLNEYQKQAARTDMTQGVEYSHIYYALGLNGEAGEVAELVKKRWRKEHNGHPVDYEKYREEMRGELGDVLWYLSRAAAIHDWTLEEVAQFNLAKLAIRHEKGKIVG